MAPTKQDNKEKIEETISASEKSLNKKIDKLLEGQREIRRALIEKLLI